MTYATRRWGSAALWHTVLLSTIALALFPLAWAFLTSFKAPNEIYGLAAIADHPTLDNYVYAITRFPLVRLLGNTTVMAFGVAGGQVIIAVLAAFALVYLAPRRRGMFTALLALALIVPAQTLIIPQFLLTAQLGWQNTQWGLIVPQLGACGLAVLLLIQHVDAVPASLSAAARLDGARPHEVLWFIVLPALRPAIASVFILVFIATWNEYLWPLLVAGRIENTTVQIGLNQFITAEGNNYGGLLAATMLTSIPIVIVYLIASRRITDAFLTSGVK
jgi:ABC-type glycerol-3-phosphate transport system permease component